MAQSGAQSLRASGAGARDHDRDRGRTPAQWYCLLAGLALLGAGIFGFIADATFDSGNNLNGDSFLGFEVNGWHNVVHILSGLLLLSAFRRRGLAKTIAIVFGLTYGVVTLIGLIDGNDVLGIIPVNPADNILHIALTALALFTGFTSPGDDARDHARAPFESSQGTRVGA